MNTITIQQSANLVRKILAKDFGMEVTEASYMEFKMAQKAVPVAPNWTLEPKSVTKKD